MKVSTLFGGIGGALRTPLYRRFFLSNFVSTIGRWLYRMAVGWLTWELTHSPAWLGVVAFCDTFPMVVFSPIAGAIADRIGNVRIMRVSQFFTFLVVAVFAALVLADLIVIELVPVLAALFGVLEAVSTPPRSAVVHALVPKGDLASAIALASASFNACRVLGPALAGVLILMIDIGTVLAIAALGLFQLFCVLMSLPRESAGTAGRGSASVLGDVREGLVYTARHPGIRFMMILLIGTGLFVRPFMDMLPGFAAQVFGRGPEGLSLLLSSIGAGALCACLWLARRGRTERLTLHVTDSLAISGMALILFTVMPQIWLAAFCLLFVGFFMLVGGVGAQTLIQSAVEPRVRARVVSIYVVISWGLPALGAIVIGWFASFFGLQHTVAAGAAMTIVMWLVARPAAKRVAPALERPPQEGGVGSASGRG